MKQKRAKSYRKQMQVYQTTFKFKTPIQCVVDSEIILHAEKTKFDLIKGINRTIQVEPKLFITQCCINHLYETKNQPAIEIAKLMEKRRCGHKDTLSSHDCIKAITCIDGENKHRYLVVTQDEKLRKFLRKMPGVPLVYMNRSVMIMEPLSVASTKVVRMIEQGKLTGGLNDPNAGRSVSKDDEKEDEDEQTQEPPKKKRKGPKGPNPLSIKKKKVVDPIQTPKKQENDEDTGKKKRKRSHKKKGTDDITKEEDSSKLEETVAKDNE